MVAMTGVKKTNGATNDAFAYFRAFIQRIYENPFTKRPFMRIGRMSLLVGRAKRESQNIEMKEVTIATQK